MGGGICNSDSPLDYKRIVFYCEGKQYYHSFKPILDTFDRLNTPYTYFTSDENDLALKRNAPNATISYIGKGNTAYNRLNFLSADICVLTTPSLNVLQIKRSKGVKHYCHIVHSLTPMTYRTFGVDYFDSVLVANEIQADFVREIEKAHGTKAKYIAVVGSTYLDELKSLRQELLQESPKDKTPTILISPSWGKETLLSKYGLKILNPLALTGYNIIIRPHPQSLISEAESKNIAFLQDSLISYKNVSWDIGTPNVIAFSKSDLMISDFSSVIFDFVCLESKPVLTMDFNFDRAGYDLADIYDDTNIDDFWTFRTLKSIGGKIKESDFDNIKAKIDSTLNNKTISDIPKILWRYPLNAGVKSAMEILSIQKNLLESSLNKSILTQLNNLNATISTLKKDNNAI